MSFDYSSEDRDYLDAKQKVRQIEETLSRIGLLLQCPTKCRHNVKREILRFLLVCVGVYCLIFTAEFLHSAYDNHSVLNHIVEEIHTLHYNIDPTQWF